MTALLCCLYVQLGMAGMLPTPPSSHYAYWLGDINHVVNPYGTVEIGYDRSFGNFGITFDVRHISSLPAKDHGENTAEIGLRWYPFREQ